MTAMSLCFPIVLIDSISTIFLKDTSLDSLSTVFLNETDSRPNRTINKCDHYVIDPQRTKRNLNSLISLPVNSSFLLN